MKFSFPDIGPLNQLRLKIGSYFLQQEIRIRKRGPQGIGLASARNIGLVFNAQDEKTFKTVRDFSQFLRDGGKRNVKALGYVPKTEVASFLQSSQDFDFFSKDDFNWYFRPHGQKVADFISQPFDILIDLRKERFIPFLFIVGLSRSQFKVGRFGVGDEAYYDLMIKVNDDADISYFVEQIKHYLHMLDQPEENRK